jgi:uncharacterized protein (DUF2236 family)
VHQHSDRAAATAPVNSDSVARKIHRERLMLLGWGRAIAMQFAHPLIAAGVGDHSSFSSGRLARFQRLHGTVRAMLSLTFGDEASAFRTAQGINKIHDRVHGVLKVDAGRFRAGTPYSAHDPILLHWVLTTLLDSIPMVYTRFIGPLSEDEQDRYCQESGRLGRWLGIPEDMLPQSMDDVRTSMQQMMTSGDLVVTDTARGLLQDVIYPPFQLAYWPAAHVTRLATIGLLDSRLREQYGLTWTDRDERALARWTSRLRGLRSIAPDWARYWPDEQRGAAAERRR